MLQICLFTLEDEGPERIHQPIFRELSDWLFVQKGLVRLHAPKSDAERWATNLDEWHAALDPLTASNDLVFCTIDLRVPIRKGDVADLRHGLSALHKVKERHDDGLRGCVLTGMSGAELQELMTQDLPDVLFDFKGETGQGYRNVVNYIKSQVLALIDGVDFRAATGRMHSLVLGERTGRVRDQILSKAPYYVDAATWHVPTLLIGAPGMGRRTFLELVGHLADAEVALIDLSASTPKENLANFMALQTLRGDVEEALAARPGGKRRLVHIADIDQYEPGLTFPDSESCLIPLRALLKSMKKLGSRAAEPFPINLAFSVSGRSRLRIRSPETRAFIRVIEESIGEMTDYPLQHLGMDENGWTLDHPRILRLPSLRERGTDFAGRVIDRRLRTLRATLSERLPGYRGEELTLSDEVRDVLADKTDWSREGNLAGLVSTLDDSFETFLKQRARGEFRISRGHLNPTLTSRLSRVVLNLDEIKLNLPGSDGFPQPVIERADFKVESGELLVILGPSGCGKSTILRLISGLLFPTAGRVTYRGKPVTGPSEKIGMIFQSYSLFPWLTVKQNIAFGPRRQGWSHADYWPRAKELLKVARLEGFDDRYPHKLSGGEQQRTAIVRSLVNRPDVLLMDEPFGALDVQTRWQMQEFLIEARQLAGQTIVFVTHDIDEAVYVGDRILICSPRPLQIGDERIVPFAASARKEPLRRDPVFVTLVNQVRESLLALAGRSRSPGRETHG